MRFASFLLCQGLTFTIAQSTASPSMEGFPVCGQLCLIEAFGAGLCAPTDALCMCKDEAFQTNVTACVQLSCTIPESLTTQNASLSSCGAPVRDRSHDLIAHSTTMFAFAWAFVLIRVAYKILMKLEFGMDDWFLLGTAIAAIPQLVILISVNVPNGLGKDIWTLSADQITTFLKYWYIVAIIYFFQTTLIKLAFISFYMRIFTTLNTKRLLWGTFAFVSLWGLAFVILAIFVCTPISYLWTQWDGQHDGSCVNDAAYVWTNAAMNIALDFWILAIPLWELRKLRLHWKKKVGVALMFCLGAFVTVMSILRLKSLVLYQHRSNVTWEFSEVSLWSSIEIGVGVICACLPTLRLLLVKIWPVLAGSTHRRSDQWYQSGKGSDGLASTQSSRGRFSPSQQRAGRAEEGISRIITSNGPREDTEQWAQQRGIGMDRSFTVQYSEGSSISLVLMATDKHGGEAEAHGKK